MTRRHAIAGLLAISAYVAVALATLGPSRPLRPFYDGQVPPQPYQYVSPPPEFEDLNTPPQGRTRTIEFVERDVDGEPTKIFDGTTMTTPDGQVSLSLPNGVFEAPEDATGITVTITPLNPAEVDEPPDGLEYQGNAAGITAVLEPSGEPATLAEQDCSLGGCASVILRYPSHATQLFRYDGSTWIDLEAQNATTAFSLFAATEALGVFAATAPPISGSNSLTQIIAFVAGGLVVVGAVALQALRRKRRRTPSSSQRTSGGKRSRGQPAGRSGQARTGSKSSATRGKRRR